MKKSFFAIGFLFSAMGAWAQHVEFEEYKLSNGLHVILQQDKSAPVVTASVMYHVGAKDENPDRTGFAHFFEHLLFEGTENIGRGQWFKIVSANGGQNNANTTDDRTYYYETFPSNNLQLGLWLESERMLHPVINQIGVNTQREVVKEEKRLRVDNVPYGQLLKAVKENVFKNHPYRWTTIGEMAHLDAATLDEFKAFFKKFYVPNNAVLVVAGDFDKVEAKKWIEDYYASVPAGPAIVRKQFPEDPITNQINASYTDPNVQLPMLINAYRIPSFKDKDSYVLDFISNILSNGKSSRLYKRIVDEEKTALQIGSFAYTQEDYGTYFIYGLPMPEKTTGDIQKSIDAEIDRISTELISEEEYQKTLNSLETSFVKQNTTTEGIAENLATNYLLRGNTNLINSEIEDYRSITREAIRDVAKKYLQANQRLVLDYVGDNK
jgi:zinc protease